MVRMLFVASLACMMIAIGARSAPAQSTTGAAKFTPGGNEAYTVSLGDKVKLNATLKLTKLGAGTPVSCTATVQNTTVVKMYYSYNVAFLDKDKNLIGCHHFSLFLDPGKQGMAGTFLQLPADQIQRIAYYSVAFHESDSPIGSK